MNTNASLRKQGYKPVSYSFGYGHRTELWSDGDRVAVVRKKHYARRATAFERACKRVAGYWSATYRWNRLQSEGRRTHV